MYLHFQRCVHCAINVFICDFISTNGAWHELHAERPQNQFHSVVCHKLNLAIMRTHISHEVTDFICVNVEFLKFRRQSHGYKLVCKLMTVNSD